jgi:hypothetical protein
VGSIDARHAIYLQNSEVLSSAFSGSDLRHAAALSYTRPLSSIPMAEPVRHAS